MSPQDSSGEANVCVAALPVLARHIESAREQAQQAVLGLNKHFIVIMQQLQEMAALAAAVHDGGSAAFDRIDQAFMSLTEAYADVAEQQTELARRGGGISEKLTALLVQARENASSEFVEQVEAVTADVFDLMDAQAKLSENTRAASGSGETRVDAALAPYGEALSKLAQYSDGMRAEVGECLMSLQFQDRLSQILCHVTASMQSLTQYLQRSAQPISESGQRFLEEMTRGYTTDEQHENHRKVLAASGYRDR